MCEGIDNMQDALDAVAPGTELRAAIDMIRAADTGAIICIGDVENVVACGSGGFEIDTAFTPNRLFELAKMDGAIVLDAQAQRILRANLHLTPTVDFKTKETGMRHRTAARMSVQTDALVITVSQRRSVADIYFDGKTESLCRNPGDHTEDMTILAMKRARDVLDREIARLTRFEDEAE